MKGMQVISSFEYSTSLELAINQLEEKGILTRRHRHRST